MPTERVVIVGAGIGGLVAALELASKGLDVTLVERAAQPGGKMREVEVGGSLQDAGPTVFTMRWVFEELFAAVGTTLAKHLALQPVQTLARHAWSEGERLDLFADIERSVQAIGEFAGAAQARGYREFCRRAQGIYETLERPFLRGSRPNPLSLTARAGLAGLPGLLRISPFATMWHELGRYFTDPRLRQLFGRYATYCGSSPFAAPATLMLVAHVEREGVWLVQGGMHRIAAALADLATQRGATIRYATEALQIVVDEGQAIGVRIGTPTSPDFLPADAVVFNGDVAALGTGLLTEAGLPALRSKSDAPRSLSALTWNLVARASGFPLLRHTVFFSKAYEAEFDDLLGRGRLPADPTVYVCAHDRDDADHAAPHGPERLMCLVNAPPTGDTRPPTREELARCEQSTFDRLQRCGLQLERRPEHTRLTTPADFERLFPATGGALYGQASHGWKASFSRPGARSAIQGLYLAGGSTHPGPGVPMAALSGRQAVASVLQDLASMHPLHPVVMPGGMSTR